ncbi:MAG: MFS transporter [Ignavibacteria bacterium]|nr:MFS transporter [Ignavibacteria bacterium]
MNVSTYVGRLRAALGLEHNIVIMLGAIVLLGLGEELWARFIPKYLELLGATAWGIAAYGTLVDFLDALYQYPGGWFADRFGRKKALLVFTLLTMLGYLVYLFSTHWVWILAGTVFVMAWDSLSSPTIFAIIGDHLPQERRAVGFGVQSLLKRLPIVIAPSLGGMLVVAFGFVQGIHIGLMITLLAASMAVLTVHRLFQESERVVSDRSHFTGIWREMDRSLKRLLFADCLARWAEGIPKVFIVLYTIDVLHATPFQFGWLTSLQMVAAILVYLPIAKLSDRVNRKPFVLLTFAFFTLFPLVLVCSTSFVWIVVAFIVGGLREIGEPARKALIVDLARESARGRAVGVYYLIRGLVVFPASFVGGWLWTIDKQFPFFAAFGVGVAGFVAYALTGRTGRHVTSS